MHLEIAIAPADQLVERFVADFIHEARHGVRSGRNFLVALPGGSVAEAFLPPLTGAHLDWDRVEFFAVDERAVPPSSPESNHGVAERLLFRPANVPMDQVHRMHADENDEVRSTEAYADELHRFAGRPPELDYVLLGMGADGHVASLFPERSLLREENRPVAYVGDAPKPPPRRMTLTLPTLCGARRVAIGAFGKAKAATIAEAVRNPGSQLPVALVMRRARRVLLLLDPDAGSGVDPATP